MERKINHQPRVQCPVKLSFKNEEIKTSSGKQNRFVFNRPALQEMVKEVFRRKRK
jgi:hypothetical protein